MDDDAMDLDVMDMSLLDLNDLREAAIRSPNLIDAQDEIIVLDMAMKYVVQKRDAKLGAFVRRLFHPSGAYSTKPIVDEIAEYLAAEKL